MLFEYDFTVEKRLRIVVILLCTFSSISYIVEETRDTNDIWPDRQDNVITVIIIIMIQFAILQILKTIKFKKVSFYSYII